MPSRIRPRTLALGTALPAILLAPAAGRAEEIRLDQIDVVSPSPIVTRPATGPAAGAGATVPVGVLPVATTTFSPVTVVTREQLARDQPRTLGDALFDRPGLSSTTYAPGAASRPIIRGLDNARVRIQENGIVNGGVSDLGEDHAVPINPLVADRLEVIRGPATLRYGSGAIGGVVSAENNRVPTVIPAKGYAGQVTSGYSTVDNGRLGAAMIDAGGDGIAVHADGFGTAADSYAIPGGIQRNSANASQGGAVGLSAIGDRGFVGVSVSHYDAVYAIPGGEAERARTRLTPNQDRVLSRGEYRPLDGPLEVIRYWAGYSVYRHDEIGIGAEGIDARQAVFKNREAEARVEAQHVPVFTALGTLTGAVGVQIDRRVINTELEAFLPRTESRANAVYLFEELEIAPGTRLQAAGRIEGDRLGSTAVRFPGDYLPVEGEDPPGYALTRRFAPKSASAGVLQDLPSGFVASLTASYVERAPTGYELFSQGPHDATATFEIGDPTLRLERARTLEASIRHGEGPLRFEATGYYTRYTGFIYKRLTGNFCNDDFASCGSGDELRQIVYSQQNATFYGAEIIGQYDAVPVGTGFFGVEGQFDFVRARFDDGTNVPRIPPYRLGGGVYVRADGWFARVNLLHAFAHTQIAPFETDTPGYNDLRAEVSYTRALDPAVYGASEVTLGVQGRNLLDDDIRNSASFKKDEILLPGRSVRLFLTARF
ncbi:putative TonB-dependent receptor [Methylobacterium crusticola]|uniref:TonB-dependent receptor n=1 Tax=Methylobacterium crusticola TaxID=1697972 RepID=A0ABQ4R8N7_9HYPH|nr:TonB-dependent receptor [Methylobacterium crusticola]GJD53696.1 putative TonB-dependent receptor [Methylobacterium crusticola]